MEVREGRCTAIRVGRVAVVVLLYINALFIRGLAAMQALLRALLLHTGTVLHEADA